ncbi:hypothetical protein GGR92_001564 [Spirosoma lacussanchae]|uniref:lytic transglycosylase domain-containing protein n=1 Tax=Spirosoma lacussanchae TaxID=1884249 RepID=UPI00293906A6|nr:lytic transglycosylase domain-containing protein [Spirosoma lacussanchae]
MTPATQRIFPVFFLVVLSLSAAVAQKKAVTKKGSTPRTALMQPRPALGLVRPHFCGEMVPTQQADVSAKLAIALAGSSGYARHLSALKARSAPFFAVIEPILKKHSIPNDFKYLPLIESAWQANAVSSAGAVGYWQFMDQTALDMGLRIDPGNDDRTDLRKSTEAACKYLKFLYRKLGSWTLVAAAYNGGVGMVERKITRVGHRDYYSMTMNAETGYYLYRILAMKELFTNPAYGLGNQGLLLASAGNPYDAEREQARRMGWLRDSDPEPVGTPIETSDIAPPSRSEALVMDSVLAQLLKDKPAATPVFLGDVSAKLVRAGQRKIGQSWAFSLLDDITVDGDELKAGDLLYAVVDDIDARGNLFLRVTKAISPATRQPIPLVLTAINPSTGLAGIPCPKVVKPGWVVQWKL